MWPQDCIIHKRDGGELSRKEIYRFITDYTSGNIPDYQAAAWLMAVYLQGMTARETTDLALAMAHSGRIADLSTVPGIKVDKHSTGGIADTTTLIVVPLVAAAGVPVAKMSGRGLGFTGGTLDKLEAIPGFSTQLTPNRFLQQIRQHGAAVMGQTTDLAPADKLLYALRDATGTVESLPLIAASIMSKKIAAGADAVVLDVKYGDGAFMKTPAQARQLAQKMVDIGTLAGLPTCAVLTSMEAPLGTAIGNSLEIDEAVETLAGKGNSRLAAVVEEIGSRMLYMAHCTDTVAAGREKLQAVWKSGAGLKKFKELIRTQGGETDWIGKHALTQAPFVYTAVSTEGGYITAIKAKTLGEIAMRMGAGRAKKEDAVQPMVGIRLFKELYDPVRPGEPLFTLYSMTEDNLPQLALQAAAAITVDAQLPNNPASVIGGSIEATI
ncbi:thymidine phosphorylase [Megasphaera hutchinsoni]|uniref:Pyrimidine-nucleoside phosphorylase n=1 Tax=Megasphaera hutchinsoni TaxID=1588748 RepID=A0A134CH60_9FIRM|nr:thymidine phosphorylase [Megasphaera hutchinsoni]KXB91568.1 pyrimidine-nucleoside phosphorylase [Megasphaera hutchinsoni]